MRPKITPTHTSMTTMRRSIFLSIRGSFISPSVLCGCRFVFGSAVPPAPAERLEQCGRVGKARRLRPDEADPGRLICPFGDQQGKVTHGAHLVLLPDEIEGAARGRFGLLLGTEGAGIGFQCAKDIGDILECKQDRLAILRACLVECRNGGPAPGRELPAVKEGLQQSPPEIPDARAGVEQLTE